MKIKIIEHARLHDRHCEVDGTKYAAKIGRWAFYIPDLQLKLLHAIDGRAHCTSESAPEIRDLFCDRPVLIRPMYTRKDWQMALSKPATRRAVENFIAAERLHAAGIGPAVRGLCLARSFEASYNCNPCLTAGIIVDDLQAYPRKHDTTQEEMLAAGVAPDRLMSAIRQQINGYVSDLNSVVGVMPIDAEDEIEQKLQQVNRALGS